MIGHCNLATPAALRESANFFDAINGQDIVLHHPYTSYNTVTNFINTAASIRM